MSESFEKAAVKSLAASILTADLGFNSIIQEWPTPNQVLTLPALSIINQPSRFFRKAAQVLNVGTVTAHEAEALYDVGDFEMNMQLDIWAKTKLERSRLYQSLFDLLNGNFEKNCYALQMTDYHNQWATYQQVGHEFVNSSENGSRSEYRAIVRLEVLSRAVLAKTEYIATQVPEVILTTPNTIELGE